MIKILLILGAILVIFLLGITIFIRLLKNFLGLGSKVKIKINNEQFQTVENKDVIYQKNDVVVLKGDAKRK